MQDHTRAADKTVDVVPPDLACYLSFPGCLNELGVSPMRHFPGAIQIQAGRGGALVSGSRADGEELVHLYRLGLGIGAHFTIDIPPGENAVPLGSEFRRVL